MDAAVQVVPWAVLCCAELRERFKGRKVMLGVDRLDMIKGIPQKLLSIEKFLDEHPEWHDNVIVIQARAPPEHHLLLLYTCKCTPTGTAMPTEIAAWARTLLPIAAALLRFCWVRCARCGYKPRNPACFCARAHPTLATLKASPNITPAPLLLCHHHHNHHPLLRSPMQL